MSFLEAFDLLLANRETSDLDDFLAFHADAIRKVIETAKKVSDSELVAVGDAVDYMRSLDDGRRYVEVSGEAMTELDAALAGLEP